MTVQTPAATFRFGDFELDLGAYELRRKGRSVKLGRQQMDLLIMLVERRRQLVTRADIVDRLWGKDVFVDVETGVNTAISKIRQALRDSADAPLFVETLPGKGYRFIAAVDDAAPPARPVVEIQNAAEPAESSHPEVSRSLRAKYGPWQPSDARLFLALLGVAVVLGWAIAAWQPRGAPPPSPRVSLAVLPVKNVSSSPDRDYLATGLTEETSASLAQIDPEHLIVKGRALHYRGTTKTAVEIGHELSVDYRLEGTVQAEDSRLRVTATLIRVRDQEHVPTSFAIVHAGLGDRAAAFESLERAVAVRVVHLIFLPVDPKWDPYRADARFAKVLADCRFTVAPPSRARPPVGP